MRERMLLRRSRSIMGSDATFLTPEGIDVDSTQNYEIVKRKVLFDDVHLVTLHRERGIAYLIVNGLFGAFFTGIAILIVAVNTDGWPWALPLLGVGLAFLVAFLIRLAIGREVITVFGRRSRATLRFGSFNKDRAREVYGQVCAAVRRGQSAMPATPEEPTDRELPPDLMPPDMTKADGAT